VDTTLSLGDLIRLAAFAAARSAHIVESVDPLPDAFLEAYWRAGRNRNHRWIRQLAAIRSQPTESKHATWRRAEPVIREIFIAEALTRVWTSVLVASDQRRQLCHAEPVARSVFVGHLEARRCALEFMVSGTDVPMRGLSQLDRLRRRAERWTDVLIGHLAIRYGVGEFAFRKQRANDFGRDQMAEGSQRPVWSLVLAGIQLAFAPETVGRAPLRQDHCCVARAVAACFPEDAFQPSGPFKSIAWLRIGRSGLAPEGPARHSYNLADLERGHVETPDRSSRTGISFRRLRRQNEP